MNGLLALSTSCAPSSWNLDRTVASFRDLAGEYGLRIDGVALHRGASADEARGLAPLARRVPIVAVFDKRPGLKAPLLVVDGADAPTEEGAEREAALEEFCRELHPLRDFAVAVRVGAGDACFLRPHEIAWVAEAVAHVGYWHDLARAGEEHLDAAGARLFGASFHPLETDALRSLRDALPGRAPAVVACRPGTSREEVIEAWRCARGEFRA